MTYNAQGIGKSGARKRLVEEVIKQTEAWRKRDRPSIDIMIFISEAVEQYKKETSK